MTEQTLQEPDAERRLPDDEVDLGELWKAVKRRRVFTLAVMFAVVLAAAGVAFLLPPMFESRVVIQIGQVAWVGGHAGSSVQFSPLETPEDLIERLRQEYRVGADDAPRPPRVEAVAPVNRRNPSRLIEIGAHGNTPEESQAFLRKVTDSVLEQHRKLFAEFVGVQRQERERLAATAARLEEDAGRLAREVEGAGVRSDPLSAILLLEKGRRLLDLNELRSDMAHWDLVLSPTNTYETRVITEPTHPLSPVKPKRVLIIVLAGAFGLFLAVCLVLVGSIRSRVAGRAA